MKSRSLAPFLAAALAVPAALALAPAADAQVPVSVIGRIEALPAGSSPCFAGATHRLKDVGTLLVAGAADPAMSIGPNVRIFGKDIGVAGCVVIQVEQIVPSPFTLYVCNAPKIGCTVTLDMCPSPTQGSYLILAAASPAFVPVGVATGSFLLDPTFFVPIATGNHVAVCESVPLTITGPPILVGTEVFFQAASQPPSGPTLLSSLAPMTIQPPSQPCQTFACF